MAMNYQPTVWERIGGPWAITLRAYLWTFPLAVLLQPVIEPGFMYGKESLFSWLAVCTLSYLAFGALLLFANKFLVPNRDVKPASVVMVLLVVVLGGLVRCTVLGSAIPVFGLTGIGVVERIPFSVTITLFWFITSSLIMDSKYRYRKQLDELVSEQLPLLESQKAYLANFAQSIPVGTKADFDISNFQLQNVFRDLAVKASTSGARWEPVARQAYRTVMNLIHVKRRPRRFSELSKSEYIASPREAFNVISQTPLLNIPVVFSFYVTSIFLAAARILPIAEAAIPLAIGLLVNLMILIISKKAIERSKHNSSFGYLTMFAVLALLAVIGPLFSSATYISVLELQIFALAGTVVEIIWIVATGLLQLSQQNRQKLIDQATTENELLRLEIQYWETITQRAAGANFSPTLTLDLIAADLRQLLDLDQPDDCQGAIECASSLVAEIKLIRGSIDEFSIESEFDRIVSTWGQEANIMWTVSGAASPESLVLRAITAIEISILKSLRYGGATVISINVNNSGDTSDVTITDNGLEHSGVGASLGVEILQELSSNTWTQERAGGINKVTAQIS
jgi:hypothetical protein